MRVLHYLVQWLWASDSFVYGPISRSRHDTVIVSRESVINSDLYAHHSILRAQDLETSADVSAVDMIHVHHGYALGEASALAEKLAVPLVCSFWGYDVTALPRRVPGYYDRFLDSASVVVVPSRYLADVVDRLGFGRDRTCIVPGSVDTDLFRPTPIPSEPRVGFVGRFVEKKGVDLLLGVWSDVRARIPGAELHLLGYGDEAPLADPESGVTVHIADTTRGRTQVRDLISSCRVYVAPSLTAADGDAESQHIGNLEAQASGRPVVTTDNGGIPEFVDSRSAVVVPEGDGDGLRDALVSLLTDRERCADLAAAGRTNATRFEATVIAHELDDLYDDVRLVGKPTGGPR